MTHYHVDAVDTEQANSSHSLVVDLVGRDARVLDVGCATGYVGAALRERGCTVVGVEADAGAVERARTVLDEVHHADLDRTSLRSLLEDRQFDVVVLADVLEHVCDPPALLADAVSLLAPGGAVVVSVPNVAHGSVRLALLQGRWDYTDTGLLDRTHLRFYTRRSVLDLLEGAGLAPTDLRGTVLDVLGSEVAVDDQDLPGAVVDWVRRQPDALVYQFVARAVVSEVRGRAVELVPAVEPPRVDDEHSRRAERLALLEQTGAEHELLVGQVLDLRRRALTARDHAIGAEAAIGTARAEVDRVRRELAEARREHAEAVHELVRARESTTWRLGSLALAPLRLVRRARPQA